MGKVMRKRNYLFGCIVMICISSIAFADQVKIARDEDISSFENALSTSKTAAEQNKPTNNFGSLVSKEAKKLKNSAPDNSKNFGNWVSEQRKQNRGMGHTGSDGTGTLSIGGGVMGPNAGGNGNAGGLSNGYGNSGNAGNSHSNNGNHGNPKK